MIDRGHDLPLTMQAEVLRIGRGSTNTDQGSHFTCQTFTGAPAGNGIAICMDGKDAWRDNVLSSFDRPVF